MYILVHESSKSHPCHHHVLAAIASLSSLPCMLHCHQYHRLHQEILVLLSHTCTSLSCHLLTLMHSSQASSSSRSHFLNCTYSQLAHLEHLYAWIIGQTVNILCSYYYENACTSMMVATALPSSWACCCIAPTHAIIIRGGHGCCGGGHAVARHLYPHCHHHCCCTVVCHLCPQHYHHSGAVAHHLHPHCHGSCHSHPCHCYVACITRSLAVHTQV